MGELRGDEHRVEAGIGELADDLLPRDHVALERRVVAMEEYDDMAGPARVERLGRGEQHGPVVVGLVLPQKAAARARMPEPAIVVDVEEGPRLARLLVVGDQAVVGEGRVLEGREFDAGAVDRSDARRLRARLRPAAARRAAARRSLPASARRRGRRRWNVCASDRTPHAESLTIPWRSQQTFPKAAYEIMKAPPPAATNCRV